MIDKKTFAKVSADTYPNKPDEGILRRYTASTELLLESSGMDLREILICFSGQRSGMGRNLQVALGVVRQNNGNVWGLPHAKPFDLLTFSERN